MVRVACVLYYYYYIINIASDGDVFLTTEWQTRRRDLEKTSENSDEKK